IKPIADNTPEGERTIAKGIQAVAGMGPTTFSKGIPQYRARHDQPIQTPVTNAIVVPRTYPPSKSNNECHVLSKSSRRSFNRFCSTAGGLGKYGSGNKCKPAVMISHKENDKTAAAMIGNMWLTHRRKGMNQNCKHPQRHARTKMNSNRSEKV